MFSLPVTIILFHIIAINELFSHGGVVESTMDGLDSICKELGDSPACVSRTLAQCENYHKGSSLLETQKRISNLSITPVRPRNCADILKEGDKVSGVRDVYPFSCCDNRPVSVWCDQTTDGGGWTVIQHREDLPIREDFIRPWFEYRKGFGNLVGEFWLGLENIHALVRDAQMELRVDLEDFERGKRWAKYEHFYVGDAATKYKLDLGKYSGDAGDSFSSHSGHKFSTRDQDNDIVNHNCAKKHRGAWWYHKCHNSNLNGFQYKGTHTLDADGINWAKFRGYNYSLKITYMSLRPKFP